MKRIFAIAFGGVFGLCAWRMLPTMPHSQGAAAGLIVLVGLLAAYAAGKAAATPGLTVSAQATATATSISTANATSTVKADTTSSSQQALVLNLNLGAREQASARFGGLDSASWMEPADGRTASERRPDLAESYEPQILEAAWDDGTLYDLMEKEHRYEE